MNSRYFVPIVGLSALGLLTALLLVVMVIKPWAGPDTSWQTHFNSAEAPPDGYSRSVTSYVSSDPNGAIQIWSGKGCGFSNGETAVNCDLTPQQAWVVYGCANCHGLSGEGGAVGPDLLVFTDDDFADRVRFGPKGMIAFHMTDLPDSGLALVQKFLDMQREAVFGGAPPTPTPQPTPTPRPAAATPDPSSSTATPASGGADSGDAELLALGKKIYEVTAGGQATAGQGCAYCHGLDAMGGGEGAPAAPEIRGATRSGIRDAINSSFDMADIRLTSEEYDAVVAYLQTLLDN